MAVMTWGPMLAIGYGDIDAQHKRLVELVNELDDAMRAGKGRDVVGGTLNELVRYTQQHFAFEEKLMDQYGVPSSAAHKAEHRQLIADVSAFVTKFQNGSASVSTELMSFLRDWLSNHILKTDRALARELLSRGAKSVAV
jgi:hemerythrin-like metal-binding protein